MDLVKLFKVVEFTWPYVKEIVFDKDAPRSDKRKRGFLFGLVVLVVFMGSGVIDVVERYVTLFPPPNQDPTFSQSDRVQRTRYLELQMTELQSRYTETQQQLNDQLRAVSKLELKLESLQENSTLDPALPLVPPVEPIDRDWGRRSPDLFDQLQELRNM